MADVPQLRDFMAVIETTLDVTEPAALPGGGEVACLAPTKGGLVGLDVETGRPIQAWKYKSVAEKPVIIHAGGRQTVIPAPPPPPPDPPSVKSPPATTWVKTGSLGDFLLDEGFPDRWKDLLGKMERAEKAAAEPSPAPGERPRLCQVRRRIIDT